MEPRKAACSPSEMMCCRRLGFGSGFEYGDTYLLFFRELEMGAEPVTVR